MDIDDGLLVFGAEVVATGQMELCGFIQACDRGISQGVRKM